MRKRKKKSKAVPVLSFIIVLLVLLILAGVWFYFRKEQEEPLTGVWQAELDFADEIIESVDDWLEEEERIAYDFVPVRIRVVFSENGDYELYLDEESYLACRESGYAYLQQRLIHCIENKLLQAGYCGEEAVQTAAERLLEDTLEEELQDYLERMIPVLFPSYERWKEEWNGSGQYSYVKEEHQLYLFPSEEGRPQRIEKIFFDADTLVFTSRPVVFARQDQGE